jgi:hypothetical protein
MIYSTRHSVGSGAYVDLGAGPLLIQNLSVQTASIVAADTQPAANVVGHVLTSHAGAETFESSSHLWARAIVDGVTIAVETMQISPLSVAGAPATTATATIANGASLSGAIDLGTSRLLAIQMPAAWTAAALTFEASYDGVTYAPVYDSAGTEISWTVGASRLVLNAAAAEWLGVRYLKVRSGTSAAPVNQAADRTLKIIGAP